MRKKGCLRIIGTSSINLMKQSSLQNSSKRKDKGSEMAWGEKWKERKQELEEIRKSREKKSLHRNANYIRYYFDLYLSFLL